MGGGGKKARPLKVVYLWNLIAHGQGTFYWGLSFTLAVIVGIFLPVTRAIMSKGKQNRDNKVATPQN